MNNSVVSVHTSGPIGMSAILGATGPSGPVGLVGPRGPIGPRGISGINLHSEFLTEVACFIRANVDFRGYMSRVHSLTEVKPGMILFEYDFDTLNKVSCHLIINKYNYSPSDEFVAMRIALNLSAESNKILTDRAWYLDIIFRDFILNRSRKVDDKFLTDLIIFNFPEMFSGA